jgi:hypothetical protein
MSRASNVSDISGTLNTSNTSNKLNISNSSNSLDVSNVLNLPNEGNLEMNLMDRGTDLARKFFIGSGEDYIIPYMIISFTIGLAFSPYGYGMFYLVIGWLTVIFVAWILLLNKKCKYYFCVKTQLGVICAGFLGWLIGREIFDGNPMKCGTPVFIVDMMKKKEKEEDT